MNAEIRRYTDNLWIKIGLVIVALGWGPLWGIIALDAVHLWPDPDPNPVGPGILFFITAWPAIICLGIGAVQVRRARRTLPLGASPDAGRDPGSPPDSRQSFRESADVHSAPWISHPVVRAGAALVGIVLIVKGIAGLRHAEYRPGAAIVLGVAGLYWGATGRLPTWLRR